MAAGMIVPVFLSVILAMAPTVAAADPAAACRAAHEADPQAHIACLESALRARKPAEGQAEGEGDGPVGLGAEQVVAAQKPRDAPLEQATVKIVSTSYDNSRELGVFRMEDGQVWQETEKTPRYQRLEPDGQYTARIVRNKLGGYRMYVDGVRRMIKLKRLE
jgi:hypothetical protein